MLPLFEIFERVRDHCKKFPELSNTSFSSIVHQSAIKATSRKAAFEVNIFCFDENNFTTNLLDEQCFIV